MVRGIITTAVLAYLAVLACALWAPGAHQAAAAEGSGETAPAAVTPMTPTTLAELPFRGAGFQIQRVDWMDRYKKCIDEIAAVGGDSVLMVVDTRMERSNSDVIWLDMRKTPTPEQLGDLIQHAKSRKLRVIIMPIVLLDQPVGTEWRGTIKPMNWLTWWDSYRAMLHHFAWVSQGYGADVLVIGSELVTTEDNVEQWDRTIADVRKTFKGLVTYSANWDHYASISFWDKLDLVGMNSYYKLGEDQNVSLEHIKLRWQQIQEGLLAFQRRVHKPLLFTEVGWCSLANAASEPWDYTRVDTYGVDLDLQKRLYEGFFESWYGVRALGGFMVWEWNPGDGGPDDKGYTPENKPAEKVLRQWLAKPAWQVKP